MYEHCGVQAYLARISAVSEYVLEAFLQHLQANINTVSKTGHDFFLPHPTDSQQTHRNI
jgi:hypothetical protein